MAIGSAMHCRTPSSSRIASLAGKIVFAAAVALLLAFILLPFVWQLLASIKPLSELTLMPAKWIPSKINTQFYHNVFEKRPFLRYLLNSLVVASITTVVNVFFGSLAAYALARLRFPGKRLTLMAILTISMFPAIATISPMFLFLRAMHLLNDYMGLVIPYTAFALPFTIWMLTNFLHDIPKSIEEAAFIDGCSVYRTYFTIILPLAAPGIFSASLLTFIMAWNEFLYALTFMTKDLMRTVPVAIALFPGKYDLPWGDMAAASIVVTLPLIALVLVFQKQIISGLTNGGVKE
jgi:multiple sugar transport system permease protein